MPICEGCGGSYDDEFKFCPYCGRSKPEEVLLNAQVKNVQVAVDKTNAELAINRLKQDIKELRSRESSLESENYFSSGLFGVIGFFISLGFLGSEVIGLGLIFLVGSIGMFLYAVLGSSSKNSELTEIRHKISEKRAKINEFTQFLENS